MNLSILTASYGLLLTLDNCIILFQSGNSSWITCFFNVSFLRYPRNTVHRYPRNTVHRYARNTVHFLIFLLGDLFKVAKVLIGLMWFLGVSPYVHHMGCLWEDGLWRGYTQHILSTKLHMIGLFVSLGGPTQWTAWICLLDESISNYPPESLLKRSHNFLFYIHPGNLGKSSYFCDIWLPDLYSCTN